MATSGLYKGFSSYQYEYNKSLKLLDVELVKRDLFNHIFTRLGERVEMPIFGTRIPDLLFEQLDDDALSIVETDLTTVFEYDPRVSLIDLVVTPLYDQNAIIAKAKLNYIELNLTDVFDVRLDFQI
jgi:phage baseplate assembly protein W